jgi:hypothetical protein
MNTKVEKKIEKTNIASEIDFIAEMINTLTEEAELEEFIPYMDNVAGTVSENARHDLETFLGMILRVSSVIMQCKFYARKLQELSETIKSENNETR